MTDQSKYPRASLDRAALTLSAAFADDPLMRHVFPDDPRRERRIKILHRPLLNACAAHGGVEFVGDGAAIAAWVAGSKVPLGIADSLAVGMGRIPVLTPPAALRRLLRHDHEAERAVTSGMSGLHFAYLWVVGVAPRSQGLGFGRAVIEQTVKAMSGRFHYCALKTETAANVPIYERIGFEIFAQTDIPSSGLTSWAMRATL